MTKIGHTLILSFRFGVLHSLAIRAVGGVDGDLVALVDEERNHDLGAGLKSTLLKGAGRGCVALYGWLCVGHLKGNVCRKLAGKAFLLRLGDEHHLDMLPLLHEVGVLDNVVRQVDLLVGLLVHEVESVLVRIEELVRTSLDVDDIDLHACREGVLKDPSVLKVTKLCLYECRTLSWLNVLEIDYLARLAVVADIKAVLKICCCCHKNYVMNLDFKRLMRNHFDHKVNYLRIFLQKILSDTCSKSHPGVEVAPQTPTLSPSLNQSEDNSDASEMW